MISNSLKINDKVTLDNKVYIVVGFKTVNRQTHIIVREAEGAEGV